MTSLDPATYRRRRRSILARLARANRALARTAEHDATQLVPPNNRPGLGRPVLGRKALTAIRARLTEELALLDDEWARQNRAS